MSDPVAAQSIQFVTFIPSVVGAVAGGLVIGNAALNWYRAKLGRRRNLYARIGRLGPGTQLSFFESVLGEPPAIQRTITRPAYRIVVSSDPEYDPSLADPELNSYETVEERAYRESIFVDRECYIQAVANLEDTVLAFSVTTRRKRFRPRFQAPPAIGLLARIRWRRQTGQRFRPFFKIQLGKSKFTDLDPPPDEEFTGPHFKAMLGARVARYSELDYFGNPGHYLTYVFTAANSTWAPARWELLHQVIEETGYREWPYPIRPDLDELGPSPSPEAEPEWEDLRAAQRFRADTVISTFTAIHPDLWADNFPVTFGPHGDEVRLIP